MAGLGRLGWRTDDFNLKHRLGRILFHLLIFLSPSHPRNVTSPVVDEQGLFPWQLHCEREKSEHSGGLDFDLEDALKWIKYGNLADTELDSELGRCLEDSVIHPEVV